MRVVGWWVAVVGVRALLILIVVVSPIARVVIPILIRRIISIVPSAGGRLLRVEHRCGAGSITPSSAEQTKEQEEQYGSDCDTDT